MPTGLRVSNPSGGGEAHSGQVAIVTGAASGIGRACAEQLAAEGAAVVAVDMDEAALAWTEGRAGVVARRVDVAEEADNQSMVETALAEFGRVDALVLNAGVATPGSLEDLPLEQLDRCLAVNLRGVVLGVRAALPALRRSTAGAVVVTASVSGLAGDPMLWAYNAAKGAVVNLVRAAALDLCRDGIRINGICPGPIRTGMTAAIEEHAAETFEALRRNIPLQRWGEPEEVARAICFLASPAASFITGALLPVDGGISANTGQFAPPQAPRAEAARDGDGGSSR